MAPKKAEVFAGSLMSVSGMRISNYCALIALNSSFIAAPRNRLRMKVPIMVDFEPDAKVSCAAIAISCASP